MGPIKRSRFQKTAYDVSVEDRGRLSARDSRPSGIVQQKQKRPQKCMVQF